MDGTKVFPSIIRVRGRMCEHARYSRDCTVNAPLPTCFSRSKWSRGPALPGSMRKFMKLPVQSACLLAACLHRVLLYAWNVDTVIYTRVSIENLMTQ